MGEDPDSTVKAWLLNDFQKANLPNGSGPIGQTHLAGCRPSARVTSCERGWVCDCTVPWEPSHHWCVRAELTCDHGAVIQWNPYLRPHWLPDEVRVVVEADRIGFECRLQPLAE